MREIIARIKLAPGEVGYYDDYSRIYLTMGSPVADVYAGTNCTQIKRSVASGRLQLISGSFSEPINEEVKKIIPVIKPVARTVSEIKTETVMQEEAVVEETDAVISEAAEELVQEANAAEESIELVQEVVQEESVVEEVKVKSRRNKKKKAAEDELQEEQSENIEAAEAEI